MSELADIEGAVIDLIVAIEDDGQPVFHTVAGIAAADRRVALAGMSRWVRPAAAVLVEGRERAGADGVAGDVVLSVLIACDGLRSTDAGRVGDADTRGAFELAGRVGAVLDGAMVAGAGRIVAVDGQVVGADERSVTIRQHWRVDSAAASALPTFGGEIITGTEAIVSVQIGPRVARVVTFAFPGIDGVFHHALGARGRAINWAGLLRAEDDTALNAIESAIDALVGNGQPRAIEDASGRVFDSCVVERWARVGARRRSRNGKMVQAFEITFVEVMG